MYSISGYGPFDTPMPDEKVFAICRSLKLGKDGVIYTSRNAKDVEIVEVKVFEVTFEEPFSLEDGYNWHGTGKVEVDESPFPRVVPISKANVANTMEEAQKLLEQFREEGLYVRADGSVQMGK